MAVIYNFFRLIFILVSLLALYTNSFAIEESAIFDQPVTQKIISSSPDSPSFDHPKRTCSYYPSFMIKEIYIGEIGDSLISITPITKNSNPPKCDNKNDGEIILSGNDEAVGYFIGAKGKFLFFDAGDSYNGGLPFAIFTKNGKKLFEDSRLNEFNSISLSGNNITMSYRRLYSAKCSLVDRKLDCWNDIKSETGLTSTIPDCTKSYEELQKRDPKYAADLVKDPSVLEYDVVVQYKNGKLYFNKLNGKINCYPAE